MADYGLSARFERFRSPCASNCSLRSFSEDNWQRRGVQLLWAHQERVWSLQLPRNATITIIKPHNIIFAEIRTALNLNEMQWPVIASPINALPSPESPADTARDHAAAVLKAPARRWKRRTSPLLHGAQRSRRQRLGIG